MPKKAIPNQHDLEDSVTSPNGMSETPETGKELKIVEDDLERRGLSEAHYKPAGDFQATENARYTAQQPPMKHKEESEE